MITTDYFNQPQNNRLAEENFNIVLNLWKEGKFQSELQKELHLDSPNAIKLITEYLYELGLLEIKRNEKNEDTSEVEPYYYFSDENINAI